VVESTKGGHWRDSDSESGLPVDRSGLLTGTTS